MKRLLPRWGDSLIALSVFALALTGALSISGLIPLGKTIDAVGIVLMAVATLPLAWRYRAPLTMLWLMLAAWLVYVFLGYVDTTAVFGPVVAIYTVAVLKARRTAIANAAAAIVIVVGWIIVGVFSGYDTSYYAIIQIVLAFAIPLFLGLADARRNARLVALELEQERRTQAAKIASTDAVRAERARIARELHDVVAHEITVMTLHAEGARRKAPTDEMASSLSVIAEAGRKGLAEMQRVIGVLRTSEQELRDEANELRGRKSADEESELAPTPRLDALEKLASQVRAAGLPTELSVEGNHPIPAIVEVSAYRIVQEALTNAMKYAGEGATATVRVMRAKRELRVLVEDNGRGAIMEAAQSSGGHGIAGMQERVSALGGSLEWGPRSGGGFRIEARLPYQGV